MGQDCASDQIAMDMTNAAADFPALTGELVDGRYEHELVTDYPVPQSQGTVTAHTLIEQKRQDEGGRRSADPVADTHCTHSSLVSVSRSSATISRARARSSWRT